MSNQARVNWLNSMTWQVRFYSRSSRVRRNDPEFEWRAFERTGSGRLLETRRFVKQLLYKLGLREHPVMTMEWLHEHADLLWNTRVMLADDLSRLLFDSALVVRLTNYRQFYFPRIDFDDLVDIIAERPFEEMGFPHDYLGVPLKMFDVMLHDRADPPLLRIITGRIQLHLVNSYRQYLIRRNGFDLSPKTGDVVYDCGACIGEVSLLFADMVAPEGEVHLFDPMPLHTRFCKLQMDQNTSLATHFYINTCAVGGDSHSARGALTDLNEITPGAVSTDDFACTTLDDYASGHSRRVDFIKMDIEGAEMAALEGSRRVLGEYKPRLAISAYHKPEDLWEIPNKLKDLNPDYLLMFGHHTPIFWESVFYAADKSYMTTK